MDRLTSLNLAHADELPVKIVDGLLTSEMAGLRYVSDTIPGVSRKRTKTGFRYIDAVGKPIVNEATIQRIKSLAIPPAWTDVWISPWDKGHIQATGRDARNRKQYRYHKSWREVRDETKYERMIGFGKALPLIRKRVNAALALPRLPREKVLATVIYLLQVTMMRIGNDEYAKQNKSFGLTTLRNKHVRIDGSDVQFHFRGKSGVEHAIQVHDRRLARIIKRIRELPGQELFQYVDDEGQRHSISSLDANEYLRELTGENYTAKDFRTWYGTVLAAATLHEFEGFESEAQAKKNVVRAIEAVAEKLGNTPTICRKCYIHPLVINSYLDGTLQLSLEKTSIEESADADQLSAKEEAILAFLQNIQTKNIST